MLNILANAAISAPFIAKFSLPEGSASGAAASGARPPAAGHRDLPLAPAMLGNEATVVLKASQTQLSRRQSVADIAHVISQLRDTSPSDDATLAQLTAQLNGMVGALSNLGDSFDSSAPAGSTQTGSLSDALESVSKAQAAIAASADMYYQSSLDEKAGSLAATMTETLLQDINTASGNFNFSIEQTLLQADGSPLRDSSTISALVTYLLQQ